jgi:hypothetical protein
MALIDKLSAIGDAIRAKTGGTEKMTLDGMPLAISTIGADNETLLKSVIEKSEIDIFSLPNNIEKIGPYVFRGHPNIKFTTLANGVKEIGVQALSYCNTLEQFTLPTTITQLENQAFYSCPNLKEVTFLGKPAKISANVFQNCGNLTKINVAWAEGEVANAPWGNTNATIHYNSEV